MSGVESGFQELLGVVRIWQDVLGFVRSLQELTGVNRSCQDLAGDPFFDVFDQITVLRVHITIFQCDIMIIL